MRYILKEKQAEQISVLVAIAFVAVVGSLFAISRLSDGTPYSKTETSAASKTNADRSVELDQYGDHFEIHYWSGPEGEDFARNPNLANKIAEAGFTMGNLFANSPAQYQTSLKALEKANVKAFLGLFCINNYLVNSSCYSADVARYLPGYLNNGTNKNTLDAYVKNDLTINSEHRYLSYLQESANISASVRDNDGPYGKNVAGFFIKDEPSIDEMNVYVNQTTKLVNSSSPMYDSYVNLFPNYASVGCLSKNAIGSVGDCAFHGDYTSEWFYANSYLPNLYNNTNLKYLAFDYYPTLKANGYTNTNRINYYTNLVDYLNIYKQKRNDDKETVPINTIALTGSYIDQTSTNSYNQISYQVNTNLAFGMKSISYFEFAKLTCAEKPWPGGYIWYRKYTSDCKKIVDSSSSNTTNLFSQVKKVNQWAFNLGNMLYNKEVGTITRISPYTVASKNIRNIQANLYRDTNIVDNNKYLGAITAIDTTTGAASEAIVTSFDDASWFFVNGNPYNSTAIAIANTGLKFKDMEWFDAVNNEWVKVSKYQGNGDSIYINTDSNRLFLAPGGAVLMRLAPADSGVITLNTGIMLDREKGFAVLYSNNLNDAKDSVYSTKTTLTGTQLNLNQGAYSMLILRPYPASSTCTLRPSFLWTGFGGSYESCKITTNDSNALKVGKVDDNYMYVKYKLNGRQVKNIPIVSGSFKSGSNYTISGDKLLTNSTTFDINNIIIKNGIAELDNTGKVLNIYTWPKKIFVASYIIDKNVKASSRNTSGSSSSSGSSSGSSSSSSSSKTSTTTKKQVTITFNGNGGTTSKKATTSVQTANANAYATLTANPFTRTGYKFTGWTTKKNGTGTKYADKAMVYLTGSTGITLYAQWEKKQPLTITFNGNGGTTSKNASSTVQTVYKGEATALTANPFTRTGYTFTGWTTNKSGTGTKYADGAKVTRTSALTLYAQWEKRQSILVIFYGNGGTTSGRATGTMQLIYKNEPTALTANPFTRSGYTFTGWNTNKSGTGTKYANKAKVTQSSTLILYAQWKKK